MRYLFVAIGSMLLLGLSVWVIAPAPTRWLLTFAVGAPEVSPWLIVGNLVFLSLGLLTARQSGLGWATVAVSCLALILTAYPLSQFHAANQAANQALAQVMGENYPVTVAPTLNTKLRSQPFVLADSFRGIATAPVRETTGIPFAQPDGVPLTLTLYQPAQADTYPAIVMIYGGSWQTGSPRDNATFARYMANQGYVVWAISYRHAPEYQFPAQIEDVRAALEFLKDHAGEYDTDANRVALLGRSAGAHLAMLAAYQPGPLPIRAVVDYYG
ncbi:MAG: alpha/beta hydrolase fold domain-containing protein, partial [Cyanobacteria bacterium J06638_6]